MKQLTNNLNLHYCLLLGRRIVVVGVNVTAQKETHCEKSILITLALQTKR